MPAYLSESERQKNLDRTTASWYVIMGLFAVLSLRFFFLQVVEYKVWHEFAEKKHIQKSLVPAVRGNIYDRNRVLIADWETSFGVAVIPAYLDDRAVTELAALLDSDTTSLRAVIKKNRRWSPFLPAPVADGLDFAAFARVEENRLIMPGVETEVRPSRRYSPQAWLACHVLGYLGEINDKQIRDPRYSDYRPGDLIGQAGIERSLEETLRGKDGVTTKLVDALGREISSWPASPGSRDLTGFDAALQEVARMSSPQEPGQSVVLTIDLEVQKIALERMSGHIGAAVVMDSRTGEILALASSPAYDPGVFLNRRDSNRIQALLTSPDKALYNRAVSASYPPGSIIKIAAAAAGLEEGAINTGDKIFCNGKFEYHEQIFRCWNRNGHGHLNLEQALAESCDVYFYELGDRLGIKVLKKYYEKFGLGAHTGIPLTEEKADPVPDPEWKLRNRKRPWVPGDTIQVSFGQGFLLCTPLQAALLSAAVANGGIIMRPQLVHHLEDLVGQPTTFYEPKVMAKVMSPNTARIIARGMEKVVWDPGGTAYRYVRSSEVKIAGKSGTSQVTSKYTGLPVEEVPYNMRDHAWFVAYAPIGKPEIAVAVLVEHGGSGSGVAGTIIRLIIEDYFRLRGSARAEAVLIGG